MKLILILTIFCVCQIARTSAYADQTLTPSKSNLTKAKPNAKPTAAEAALIKGMSKRVLRPNSSSNSKNQSAQNSPKLKSNEYTIASDTSRKIFSTKVYDGLLLSSHCFKTKKPSCQALAVSLKKINSDPTKNLKSPYHNNFGANHCQAMGGVGLIAKTYEGHDSDFCEFKDGSLVSSWSAYFKTHPPTESLPR
jgi:putative hemolysin